MRVIEADPEQNAFINKNMWIDLGKETVTVGFKQTRYSRAQAWRIVELLFRPTEAAGEPGKNNPWRKRHEYLKTWTWSAPRASVEQTPEFQSVLESLT